MATQLRTTNNGVAGEMNLPSEGDEKGLGVRRALPGTGSESSARGSPAGVAWRIGGDETRELGEGA